MKRGRKRGCLINSTLNFKHSVFVDTSHVPTIKGLDVLSIGL